MAKQNSLVVALILIISAMPLCLLIAAFSDLHGVMITDSIPHILTPLRLVFFVLFIIITAVCWKTLVDVKLLGIAWFAAAYLAYATSELLLSNLYQQYLFPRGATQYTKRVNINQVARVVHRAGPEYYAKIDPDGFETMIEISKDLLDRWNGAAANGDSVAIDKSDARPKCLIGVTVERSNAAERIINRSLITSQDIVSC